MDTLLKWPGGKGRELEIILPLIKRAGPINCFVEPFLGGGAVFFALEPKKSVINDINPSLMATYELVAREPAKLRRSLNKIVTTRQAVHDEALKHMPTLYQRFYKTGNDDGVAAYLNQQTIALSKPVLVYIEQQIVSKMKRLHNLEKKHGNWTEEDLRRQIVTAWHAAYYTFLRDCYKPASKYDAAAVFVYIREFCYGSMFRFNKDGKFNIPYGGASYNEKDFDKKVQYITSTGVTALLRRSKIRNVSFEKLLPTLKLTANDFMFLDPPYDSVFSSYDQFSFAKKQQQDLAKIFGELKCKALMIIGKTPFIEDLYKAQQELNPAIVIEEYEKTYAYNVRGRNTRGVQHLSIRNYQVRSGQQE